MIVGAAVGAGLGLVFALLVGGLSRAVAPQPIQASFLSWVALCMGFGALLGVAGGAIVVRLFSLFR